MLVLFFFTSVGGWCSGDAIASVEKLDPGNAKAEWECVAPMNKRRLVVVNALCQNAALQYFALY